MKEKELNEMINFHWEYVRNLSEIMYKDAFKHGFKHGIEEAEKRLER